jgi:hypothetical protein
MLRDANTRYRRRFALYMMVAVLLLVFCVMLYIVIGTRTPSTPPPVSTKAPTKAPTAPTLPPTSGPTLTAVPTTFGADPFLNGTCRCINKPIYSNFPHPAHTNASFAVFNFLNDNATDFSGNNLTVYVTIFINSDGRMTENGYAPGNIYVYLDALPLQRGEAFSFVFPRNLTSNGRLAGGRIVVYYEHPSLFDMARGAGWPISTPGNLQPMVGVEPKDEFDALLEFTMDVDPGHDAATEAYIDYDLSCVDRLVMPLYIFGGYDPRTLGNATSGNNNHGFPCNKAYVGCRTQQETHDGCFTALRFNTEHGQSCLASFNYCNLNLSDTVFLTNNNITVLNETFWQQYCHQWDDVAQCFNITQQLLDLYHGCAFNKSTAPPCPPIIPPDVAGPPTSVIFGCLGKFLLENHCLVYHNPFGTHLIGSMCSALNRGLCFTPECNFTPSVGLSCTTFGCSPQPNTACFVPCTTDDCFGNYTNEWVPSLLPNVTCQSSTCDVDTTNATQCANYTDTIIKEKSATCNDSTEDPYLHGLLQNNYAQWARNKGENFYSFSLDEEVGGGNQQCLFSTQLDVVIFPRCNGEN